MGVLLERGWAATGGSGWGPRPVKERRSDPCGDPVRIQNGSGDAMTAFRPCQRGGPDVSWRLVNTTAADGDRPRGKASLLRCLWRVNAAGLTGRPQWGVPRGDSLPHELWRELASDSPATDRHGGREGGNPLWNDSKEGNKFGAFPYIQ